MKIFKKKEKELYWNPKDIDETNAVYRVVIGKRSNGKSYGTIRKAIDAFLEEGLPSAYLRRYEEEIRPKNIGDLLNLLGQSLILLQYLSKHLGQNIHPKHLNSNLFYTRLQYICKGLHHLL